MASNRNLLLNSISGFVLYFINILTVFFITPVIVKSLGNFDYGIWELLVSVAGYMGIIDFGMGPALLQNVAVAKGTNNQILLQKLVSTAFIFFLCLGAIVFLIFIIFYAFPKILITSEDLSVEKYRTVILLFALNTSLRFPLVALKGTIMGFQRHHFVNSVRGIYAILNALFVYHFLQKSEYEGIIVLALLMFIMSTIQGSIYAINVKRVLNLKLFSPKFFSIIVLKDLFTYGAKSALLMTSSRLQFMSMAPIIGMSVGVEYIIFYTIPNRLLEYARGVSSALSFPLTPYFAEIGSGEEKGSLKSKWITLAFVLQIVTFGMVVFIYFYGDKFLGLWIGREYSASMKNVLNVLIIGLMAQALVPNSLQILLAGNKHGRIAFLYFMIACASLPITYILGKYNGIIGSVSVSISVTVLLSFFILFYACKMFNFTIIDYVKNTFFKIFIPLLLLSVFVYFLTNMCAINNYVDIFVQLFLSGLIYIFLILYLSINKNVREKIIKNIFVMKKFINKNKG